MKKKNQLTWIGDMARKSYIYVITLVGLFSLLAIISISTSCAPTYPKEKLSEAVKSVCKAEYDMDVDVAMLGTTMGIYYPMKSLLDVGLGVSEEAWDKISNLLLIASRVVLSTDADVKFYCVITQDIRLPELQVAIIKYVEDIKYGMYQHISRDEAFKRTIFSINLTPQAKKERSIDQVFEKLAVEDETRQKVLDEFFRSAPTRLSDIGYWKGRFYLKEITMGEFLAEQIANRIKIDFRTDKELVKLFDYRASEGIYAAMDGSHIFTVKFTIHDQTTSQDTGSIRLKKIQEIIKIANDVVYGYQFKKFDFLVLEDQLVNVRLKVSEEDLYNFDKKKLAVRDIVQAPIGYF